MTILCMMVKKMFSFEQRLVSRTRLPSHSHASHRQQNKSHLRDRSLTASPRALPGHPSAPPPASPCRPTDSAPPSDPRRSEERGLGNVKQRLGKLYLFVKNTIVSVSERGRPLSVVVPVAHKFQWRNYPLGNLVQNTPWVTHRPRSKHR